MRKRQKIIRCHINYNGNERVNDWLNKGWKVKGYVKMDKEFIDYILELEVDNDEKT